MSDLFDPDFLAELMIDLGIAKIDFPERCALLALADAHLKEARRRERERRREKKP